VPGLARGLAVIEHLAAHPGGRTQKEIAEALGLPTVGVMRIALQLEADGYVRRDAAKRTYRLTGRLFQALRKAYADGDLVESALPFLRTLSDATGETAVLGVLSEGAVTVVDSVPGRRAFCLAVATGHRAALHASAPGKAILAALPPDECGRLLAETSFEARTPRTLRSRKALVAALDRVRREGCAFDLEEDFAGVRCVAAPVFGRTGRVAAAVWIAGPSARLDEKALARAAQRVTAAARGISENLA